MSTTVDRTFQMPCLRPQRVNPLSRVSKLILTALSIGQVIRAPDFSFLDALGALEIMDPKTDSGLIDDDGESNSSDTQSLLPEEVIWIMDQLLAREVIIL